MQQPRKWMSSITPTRVTEYSDYWSSLQPKNNEDVFRMWLFSFMSVHTTWENNVRGFRAIGDLGWMDDKNKLTQRLARSRCGFQNTRSRYIWEFKKSFWTDPERYRKFSRESWRTYRDRLAKQTLGLGLAKTTFAIELTYPTAPVCCLDRHILRFMLGSVELNGNMSPDIYAKLEARWVNAARKERVAPVMARHIFWDDLQKQKNTRYWSACLEEEAHVSAN
jgi:thermostable 8-oxoguanine DNA glycosylase